ncbi:MAG: hypothetical protein RR640_04365 [Oscillospiraceae bacterium]
MKKKTICLLVVFLFFSVSFFSIAEEIENDNKKIVEDQLLIFQVDEIYNVLPDEVKEILSENGLSELSFETLTTLDVSQAFNVIWQMILKEITKPFKLFYITIFLVILSAIFDSYKESLSNQNLKNVFNAVATLCVIMAISLPISNLIISAKDTIINSKNFLSSFVPVFSAILVSSGQSISAAAFSAVTLGFIQGIAALLSSVIVPFLNVYLALCFASSINQSFDLMPMTEIIRKGINYILTFSLTVFVGFWSLQTMVTQSADNVALKTGKLAVASFIPVVGGPLSEALGSVISCLSLVKSATGFFAIISLCIVFLPTIISCLMWLCSLSVSSAFSQMLGNNRISTVFKSTANVLKIIIATILCFMLMMIIGITVLLITFKG